MSLAVSTSRTSGISLVTGNPIMALSMVRAVNASPEDLRLDGSSDMRSAAGIPLDLGPVHHGRYPEKGMLGKNPPQTGLATIDDLFQGLPLSTGLLLGVQRRRAL